MKPERPIFKYSSGDTLSQLRDKLNDFQIGGGKNRAVSWEIKDDQLHLFVVPDTSHPNEVEDSGLSIRKESDGALAVRHGAFSLALQDYKCTERALEQVISCHRLFAQAASKMPLVVSPNTPQPTEACAEFVRQMRSLLWPSYQTPKIGASWKH